MNKVRASGVSYVQDAQKWSKDQGRTWKAVCEFVDGGGNVPLLQTASSQLVHHRQ